MIAVLKSLYDYRELMAVLAWKNATLRYKQAYLGMAWTFDAIICLCLAQDSHA